MPLTDKVYEESGYESFYGNEFVSDEDAYAYALEKVQSSEKDKKEFVDWFFSGNWLRIEKTEDEE